MRPLRLTFLALLAFIQVILAAPSAPSQDLASQDLASRDLASWDLASRNLASRDLASREIPFVSDTVALVTSILEELGVCGVLGWTVGIATFIYIFKLFGIGNAIDAGHKMAVKTITKNTWMLPLGIADEYYGGAVGAPLIFPVLLGFIAGWGTDAACKKVSEIPGWINSTLSQNNFNPDELMTAGIDIINGWDFPDGGEVTETLVAALNGFENAVNSSPFKHLLKPGMPPELEDKFNKNVFAYLSKRMENIPAINA